MAPPLLASRSHRKLGKAPKIPNLVGRVSSCSCLPPGNFTPWPRMSPCKSISRQSNLLGCKTYNNQRNSLSNEGTWEGWVKRNTVLLHRCIYSTTYVHPSAWCARSEKRNTLGYLRTRRTRQGAANSWEF